MPRFVARHSELLVSTSYKVMYSSLVESGLDEISNTEFAKRCQTQNFRHVMAVRDPYARLASFFADKLRHNLNRGPGEWSCSLGEWQYCQQVFFPLVGVTSNDTFDKIRDALLGISFDEFIYYLPLVRESHLHTQSSLLDVEGLDLRPFTKTFRIETDTDLLWRLVGVKNPPHANRSPTLANISTLTRERLDIVNIIYANDFSNFGYEMR